MRILLVEDNEMNRDMLSRRLVKKGFEVVVAVDAEQGLALVKADKPDLILMDVSLPGMSGWDATRSLKAEPSTASIPVIALTAHALNSDRAMADTVGCDGYETKPVDFPTLLGKIDSLLIRNRGNTFG